MGEKPQTSREQCEDEERLESIVDEPSQASSEEYVMKQKSLNHPVLKLDIK